MYDVRPWASAPAGNKIRPKNIWKVTTSSAGVQNSPSTTYSLTSITRDTIQDSPGGFTGELGQGEKTGTRRNQYFAESSLNL